MNAEVGSAPDHVIVVGAGMVGLSTAWFLLDRGVRVTVVDRDGVAAGSSWGNAGYLTPALTLPLAEPAVLSYGLKAVFSPSSPVYVPFTTNLRLIRFLVGFARHCTPTRWRETMAVYTQLNRISLEAYDELADGGVKEPTQAADPFLAAFTSAEDREPLLEEFRGVVEAGGTVDYDLVDGAEARSIEPMLGEGVRAGVRIRGQRYINPPAYVASLADAVRGRGGEIVDGFDVADVRDLGTAGVEAVSATGQTRRADEIVLASGTWLGSLARSFGVRKVVQAGRGYSFSVRPEAMATHPVYLPAQRIACNPLGDRLRITGMMEFRRADAPLDQRRIRAIIDAARPMFTGVDWDAREEEWVGSRPCTADGLPLIGVTRSPRVHVAGGHGMWGIVLGPLSGRFMADSITGRAVPDVVRHFDPLR
ncbi:MAG: NAD(P)/FAD-dependent oxidoreductase [Nocardioidaceae bacterium]